MFLATRSDDKSIKLASVPNGGLVLHMHGLHEGSIMGVSFSPDGALLSTASDDGSVKLLSVPNGELVLHLPGLHEGEIWGLDFSPRRRAPRHRIVGRVGEADHGA